jgi:hypothetical protein
MKENSACLSAQARADLPRNISTSQSRVSTTFYSRQSLAMDALSATIGPSSGECRLKGHFVSSDLRRNPRLEISGRPNATDDEGRGAMNIDIVTNVSDTATFFLVAPEIIGKETLNHIYAWARVLSDDKLSDRLVRNHKISIERNTEPDLKQTLTTLFRSVCGLLFIYFLYMIWHDSWIVGPGILKPALAIFCLVVFGFTVLISIIYFMFSLFVILVWNKRRLASVAPARRYAVCSDTRPGRLGGRPFLTPVMSALRRFAPLMRTVRMLRLHRARSSAQRS